MYAVSTLPASPKVKAKAGSAMTDGMLMPYRKFQEQAEKEFSKKELVHN